MEKISPADLIPLDIFTDQEPIKVDVVYARADHPENIFGEALYHPEARMWAHRDLARIILLTARTLNKSHVYTLVLKDSLRTTEAQKAMGETELVKSHPEWTAGDTIMVSPPGQGAHPRGMAIDVGLLDENNQEINMGTPFDEMTEKAYRACQDLPPDVLERRDMLEQTFRKSAGALNLPILPIPQEWWDFRLPPDIYNQYAPLSDTDLPPQMRMAGTDGPDIPDFDEDHFQRLKQDILGSI